MSLIVIPLMLYAEGKMSSPCFYMSEFFEHRNTEYQGRLLAVLENGDWTGWCNFFLNAVETQAKTNLTKAHEIFELYNATRAKLIEHSKSARADKVVDTLFVSPIFSAKDFATIEGVTEKTGRRLLGALKEMGTVREISPHSGQRAAIMVFPELLEITECWTSLSK